MIELIMGNEHEVFSNIDKMIELYKQSIDMHSKLKIAIYLEKFLKENEVLIKCNFKQKETFFKFIDGSQEHIKFINSSEKFSSSYKDIKTYKKKNKEVENV